MDNESTTGTIPMGWICPRCGKVHAPDVKTCDCATPSHMLPWGYFDWTRYPWWYPLPTPYIITYHNTSEV